MKKFILTLMLLVTVLCLKAQPTITFDDPPGTVFDELPASMNFSTSEPLTGVPPTIYIKSATQEKKLTCMRNPTNDYSKYTFYLSYYVKGDLLAEIQEAGEFSIYVTLEDGTTYDPFVFKLKKPITITFENEPGTVFDELPASMNFSTSEPLTGVPPTIYIKSATQEKKLTCMRNPTNDYSKYTFYLSYYVKGDLLAEIQEAGEFSIYVTLEDGTTYDPFVFKLKKPITITFENEPGTVFDELPASMNFSTSEPLTGVPPTIYIKSATQEKKLTCMRNPTNDYSKYTFYLSYYVKGDLLAEIQEAGEFSIYITLEDGTTYDPFVFKLKKPITITFENEPGTVFDELPASMNFSTSEPLTGVPPTIYIKSATQEKKLTCMRNPTNDYSKYTFYLSYYVKGDLLAEIQEAGEFSIYVTLEDGTTYDPFIFKLKKEIPAVTATFADEYGTVFAGLPEQIHFSLSVPVAGDATKALINGTQEVECHKDGDSNTDFYILCADIDSQKMTSGELAIDIILADQEDLVQGTRFFVVPADITWTPAADSEPGRVFSSLPATLNYTLSAPLDANARTVTGIILPYTGQPKTTCDITVPCSVTDGTQLAFDLKAISAEDVARIQECEDFVVALCLANKTLAASYRLSVRWQDVTLGYCPDDISTYTNTLGSEGAASTVGAAIKIPAAKLEGMKGGTINKIRIGMGTGLERVYAWIRPSLSEPAIFLKKIDTPVDGWNEVTLDEPYVITGDEIFIGYSAYQPAGVKAIRTGGADRPDACWLGIKDNWEDCSDKGYGSLFIQAIGSAILPAVDLGVDNLHIDKEYYKDSEKITAGFTIVNSGANAIDSYTLSWSIDDAAPVSTVIDNVIESDRQADHSFEIPLEGISEGIHTLHVSCTINNAAMADEVPGNNTASIETAVYSVSYPRTVLLEQFTTMNCPSCPAGTAALKAAADNRDDVAWVSHHVGYGRDEFTIDESDALMDLGVQGAPSLMVDRTCVRGSVPPVTIGYSNTQAGAQIIGGYIDQCAAVPAFAGITVSNTFDEDTRMLTVNISAEKNGIFSSLQPDCNYMVMLTENDITTRKPQAGASEKYVHGHVLRKMLTPIFGSPLTWDGDNFSTSFETELDASWKAYDMDIVVAINKPHDADDVNNNRILNAAIDHVNATSGISDVHCEGWYIDADGSIRADGFHDIQVYGVDGKRLANSGLSAGVYIIRATTPEGKAVVSKTYIK